VLEPLGVLVKIDVLFSPAAVLALLVCTIAPAAVAERIQVESKHHYLYDGHELKRLLDMTSPAAPPLSVSDNIDAHGALAYVMGVADAVDGIDACPTLRERSGLFVTVGSYIATHPEKLSGSAASVVKYALRAMYPCPAREGSNNSFKPKPLRGSA
jgi:hypothetical protein